MATCPVCHGNGVCPVCQGSGWIRTNPHPSPLYRDRNENGNGESRCYACDGTGRCSQCGGTGQNKSGY